MLKINADTNEIQIVQGDTGIIPLQLYAADGSRMTSSDLDYEDSLNFSIQKLDDTIVTISGFVYNYNYQCFFTTITLTEDNYPAGDYLYSIILIKDGQQNHIIPPSILRVLPKLRGV